MPFITPRNVLYLRTLLFAILGVLGGCVIMMVSILAGAFYTAAVEPNDDKITPEIVETALLIGFTTYQIIVALLMVYIALKRRIVHRLRLIIFALIPLVIWLYTPPIPWRFSYFTLAAIASLALYQVLVIRYRQKYPLNTHADELQASMQRGEDKRHPRR